jgi:3-dehydrosphinganine reductase
MTSINFNNSHAIITGGSSGIGKATAKLLASKGANVSIIARTESILAEAKAEIETVRVNNNQQVVTIAADVSHREEIEAAIQKAIAQNGPVDYLITSAGIAQPGYFPDQAIAIFEQTMAINYFGTLYAIRAVVPQMLARKKGHIVLVSSGAGLIGIYGYTTYSPTKFALRGLAESLRGEMKVYGVNVSIVYPPDTDTPQLVAENKTKPEETKQITATAEMWTAAGVAQEIVRGIEKKVFAIAPGLEISLLNRLHSILGPGINWYFDLIVAKTRQKSS